jgi:hypothetical protein
LLETSNYCKIDISAQPCSQLRRLPAIFFVFRIRSIVLTFIYTTRRLLYHKWWQHQLYCTFGNTYIREKASWLLHNMDHMYFSTRRTLPNSAGIKVTASQVGSWSKIQIWIRVWQDCIANCQTLSRFGSLYIHRFPTLIWAYWKYCYSM